MSKRPRPLFTQHVLFEQLMDGTVRLYENNELGRGGLAFFTFVPLRTRRGRWTGIRELAGAQPAEVMEYEAVRPLG